MRTGSVSYPTFEEAGRPWAPPFSPPPFARVPCKESEGGPCVSLVLAGEGSVKDSRFCLGPFMAP